MALPAGYQPRTPIVEPRTGIVLGLYASDPAFDMVLERAPDSGGSPDVGNAERIALVRGAAVSYTDYLPLDGAYRHYRLYHVGDGYADSDPTDWVKAKPVRLRMDASDPDADGRDGGRRGFLALSAEAHLESRVQIVDTTALRPIARGLQIDGLIDGQAVVFDPAFQNTPIVIAGGGGITYRSTGLTGNQRQRLSYSGLSPSGFTAVCKIEEVAGSATARTASFSTGAFFDFEANKGFATQAIDDTYTFKYRISLNANSDVIVRCYVNDGSGWVLKASRPYASGGAPAIFSAQAVPVVADGMDLNDDFALDVEVTLGGATLSLMSVEWNEGTPPASLAATGSGVTVPFLVLGL